MCPPFQVNSIYGLAVNDNGKKYMSQMGFKVVSKAKQRKDRHSLMEGTVDVLLKRSRELSGRT